MKIVSIIMIVLYLVLPVACLAHPCSSLGEIAHIDASVGIESEQSDESPVNHDGDDCESTCCCAGHIIASALPGMVSPHLTETFYPDEHQLALPRITDRIVVPPQNLA